MSASAQLAVTQPQSEMIRVHAERKKVCNDLMDRTFRGLGESKIESRAASDVWLTGSVATEARILVQLIGRGDDVASLRELIQVQPEIERKLREFAACSPPSVGLGIERVLYFRRQVLLEFDRLVKNAHANDSAVTR